MNPSWGPPALPITPSTLPVVPRAYHQFYRAPANPWWKLLLISLAVIAAVGLGWLLLGIIIMIPFVFSSLGSGEFTVDAVTAWMSTPTGFLVNNLMIIVVIPLAYLAHRIAFRQRFGYLSSIQGRFRWRLFGRFVLLALPVFAVMTGVSIITDGLPDLSWTSHSLSMILIIVLTTPLQSAGEEICMRGLLARLFGSHIGPPWVGWVVATVVSSAAFMALHGAGDPWLNTFYVCFAVIASLLVWRTGGLEAAIAMHAVNNVFSLAFVPFQDMSGIFDRQAGTGSASGLIQVGFLVVVAALFWWQARRLSLPTMTAPGAPAEAAYVPRHGAVN